MLVLSSALTQMQGQDSLLRVQNAQDFENAIAWCDANEKQKELNEALPPVYLKNARAAYEWSTKSGDPENVFRAKFLLLKYYGTNFVEDSMMVMGNELMGYENFWDREESVMIMHIVTNVYNRQEQYNELLELMPLYYIQIDRFGDHLNRSAFSFDFDLGDVYYNLQNYELAMDKYRHALQTCIDLDNQLMAASAENNVGLCYMELQEDDSAKFYFGKASQRIEDRISGNNADDKVYLRHFQNVIESNKAKYLLREQKYDQVIPIIEKELRSSIVVIEPRITVGSYYALAEIYYLKRMPEESLLYLDSTFMILDDYIYTQFRLKALQLRSRLLMWLNQADEADSVMAVYNWEKDSLDKQKVKTSVTLATVKYDTRKKESELKLSEQKLKFEQSVSNYQRLALLFLAFGLILIVLFYRRLRKNKQTIEENSKTIEKSLLEKETLLKEVHHRVKNNLQVISSLLDVKSSRFDNEELAVVIEDSQRHISSMAMVHKMLYQHDNLSKVAMQSYFEQLTENILNALTEHSLELDIKAQDVELDLDKAIPLGLIINEVLINTYKYAYPNKEGRVELSLKNASDSNVIFEYRDFGVGLNQDNNSQPSGWGMNLVQLLAEEMSAKLHIDKEKGLAYIITIPSDQN